MNSKKLTFIPIDDDQFVCIETGEVVNGLSMNGFVILPLKKSDTYELRELNVASPAEFLTSIELTELLFCISFPCFHNIPKCDDIVLAQYFVDGKLQKGCSEWKKFKKYLSELFKSL